MNCPECSVKVLKENINVATDVAHCQQCGHVFRISDIINRHLYATVKLFRFKSNYIYINHIISFFFSLFVKANKKRKLKILLRVSKKSKLNNMKFLNCLTLGILLSSFITNLTYAQSPGQVILYNDAGFSGNSISISLDGKSEKIIPWIGEIGFGNDALSSIKVGKGVKVSLWDDKGSRTDQQPLILFEGNCSSLMGWNDKISSLKLEKVEDNLPLAKFYVHAGSADQNNPVQCLGMGFYDIGNLLVNDQISMLDVPGDLTATVYTDKGKSGRSKNFTEVFNQNLEPWDFQDNISSIEIKRNGYKLAKIEILSERIVKILTEQNIGGGAKAINNTPTPQSLTKTATASYSSSSTINWENAITASITVTNTTTVEASVGPVKASNSLSVAVGLANTFTYGKSETKSKSVELSNACTVNVPGNSIYQLDLMVVPQIKEYTVQYTYIPENNPKGEPYVVLAKITVDCADDASCTFTDITGK